MSPKVVITDFMGDDPQLELELFANAGLDAVVATGRDPETWIYEARDAEAILTRHAPITRHVIAQLGRCRIIARYGTGTDNIDVEAASERSISVTNVPDYATAEVADHAWAMTLALWRRLVSWNDEIRRGGWQPPVLPVIERLAGQTLGLIGLGRIGSAVARRALAADMQVMAFDPYLEDEPEHVKLTTSLAELARAASIISLHAPLTPDTARIVDAGFLRRLRPGSIVINVARGGLLDLDAATASLIEGHLGGLGLDVFDEEPIPIDHPLRGMPDVLLSPHVAYYSKTSLLQAKLKSCEAIIQALVGDEDR
jgi:D-3-phosphoglycerate dehydrogenase